MSDIVYKRTRIKVCGMTRAEEVRAVIDLGVDAIGMILHADSPRKISLQQAQLLRKEVPAFVSLVGVFVDCDADLINQYSSQIGLDLIQLHGDETNEFGKQLDTPFIKAIRARDADQTNVAVAQYSDARALLLDPYVQGQHGGTGQRLEPSLWPQQSDHKLILAGGLSADNVAAAVTNLKPFAVDLNSGVESAPGIKEPLLVSRAVQAILKIK